MCPGLGCSRNGLSDHQRPYWGSGGRCRNCQPRDGRSYAHSPLWDECLRFSHEALGHALCGDELDLLKCDKGAPNRNQKVIGQTISRYRIVENLCGATGVVYGPRTSSWVVWRLPTFLSD